jgi:hypothetical protein
MASGHVNRIKRPNTWLHRPMLQNVKKALANSEPSTHGAQTGPVGPVWRYLLIGVDRKWPPRGTNVPVLTPARMGISIETAARRPNARKMAHGLNGINYGQLLPALCREADEDGLAQLYPAALRCWRVVFQRLETS